MLDLGTNSEGCCNQCGHHLGIGGRCSHCEVEKHFVGFWKTRKLEWWRSYWRESVRWLEAYLKRPPTMREKMAMLKSWRKSKAYGGHTCSPLTLAAVTYVFELGHKAD